MMPGHPRVIVVLGMHRCGTSAITRALRVIGVNLGQNLMTPQLGINEKGFWEDVDLNQLNLEMLEALATDWHHLFSPSQGFVDLLIERGFLPKAVNLLRSKVGDSSCFGFKDPRVTQLLQFWSEVFAHSGFEMGYVLAIRHPESVVESLRHRDGFDREKSLLLWLSYTVTMLEATTGKRHRIIVDYDRMLEHPDRELERISAAMCRPTILAETQSYKAEFLDQRLRHSVHTVDDLALDEFSRRVVGDLYGRLLAVVSGDLEIDAPEVQTELANRRSELDRWSHSSTLLNKLYAFERSTVIENTKREHELQEQKAENEDLRQAFVASNRFREAAEQSLRGCSDDLAQKLAHLQIAEQTVTKQAEQVGYLTRTVAEHEIRLSELVRSADQQQHEFENLRLRLSSESEQLMNANTFISLLKQDADRQALLIENLESRIIALKRKLEVTETLSQINGRAATSAEWRTIHLERILAVRDRESTIIKTAVASGSTAESNKQPKMALRSLLVLDEREFLNVIFKTILGRQPDAEAASYYLAKIGSRSSKIRLLAELLATPDGRLSQIQIKGLRKAIIFDKLTGIPIIRRLIRNQEKIS